MVELERIISVSALLGPVVVLGDFNAHLGTLGGERGKGSSNLQGMLLSEVMDRCNLSAVSLSSLATGPAFTYISGDVKTTVDYALADFEAASLISSCQTLPMDDLNTSDHLPLVLELNCVSHKPNNGLQVSPQIDWEQAKKSGEITEYWNLVRSSLSPLLSNIYLRHSPGC